MRRWFVYSLVLVIGVFTGWLANNFYRQPKTSGNPISQIKPRPLEKYTIDNLSKANIESVKIEAGRFLGKGENFTSYVFSFWFDPSLSGKTKKWVSGEINIPKGDGPFPVVVMFRGYVDQKKYVIGEGTQHAGEFFAKNGFITIAPDFLGFGESYPEAENIFESRFQTYTTALTLIKSVNSINQWNQKDIFIWGHSNGGQIALTLLEITGAAYPTVLWAPVSKPFPYSVLYYTDESDDGGKLIRSQLAKFEEDYDVDAFSLTNYLDRIKAPIQFHQGTSDDSVPKTWSDQLYKGLSSKGASPLGLDYLVYTGANHSLIPSWNLAISRSLAFFQKHLTKGQLRVIINQ